MTTIDYHRAAWLRAYADRSLTVPHASLKEAATTRIGLYRAANRCKKDPSADPEYLHAVLNCEICIRETPSGAELIVRRRSENPSLQALALRLGIDLDRPDETDLDDMARRLIDDLSEPNGPVD